ncbi:uncharacterized protein LOC135158114 [Lytechinus pictus]|uniref:uncharacterized protein LOC135158114 n=1 Tax=Lytechinus pictus TaxID=7653 RepID=UPI0030BA0013
MADDRTEDPTLLTKLEGVKIFDKPSREMIGPSKVKETMGQRISLHQQKKMSGSSQVKEPTEVNLRGQAPIQLKFPSELIEALHDTRGLHIFTSDHSYLYYTQRGKIDPNPKLEDYTTKISGIKYGMELRMSWTVDGTWIIFKHESPLHLQEMISALVPLCQAVEHITIAYHFDEYIHAHGSMPFIPMKSVLTVCLHIRYLKATLQDMLLTVSNCFPNAKSLALDGVRVLRYYSTDVSPSNVPTHRLHSDTPLSSLRRLEIRTEYVSDTLGTLFLSISSSCQNIESLTVESYKTLKWEKSSTAMKSCKLPNLTDIHLKSHWSHEHYALQLITDFLHVGRAMSPSLKFVKVESVRLRDVVMESVEWSRTSSECGLQIKGALAESVELLLDKFLYFGLSPIAELRKSVAAPITELIDLTTSDFKEVTVLTLVSCKIDFGQSESKSLQSPKELGTLREIRFVGSENPLSESDKNKLSELYPNVKLTEKQESQESSEESQEGEGIPSKLDKASSQSLKTSAIDKLAEIKVECHKDTGSQNPEGGEEEISWQEKEEEFDVNKGSLSNESVPDEGDVETTKKECCKRVGADGGRLRLESFGIELKIPPGAIDSKEPQEISLHVLTDTPNLGFTKDEMSVCFGVQCLAPDDLVLRSPVTYTIPHCAVATQYSGLDAVLYTGEGEYPSGRLG